MNREMYVYKSVAESRVTNVHHIIHSVLTGSRSPAGPRRLRDSDTHKRIAVPKALCVLLEYTRPRPKSGKVCRSDTRPGDVRERAECAEGSDSGPVRKAPVSACKPLCALLLAKASVYPLSPAKANVGRFAGDCDKSFFAAWYPLMEVGDGCLQRRLRDPWSPCDQCVGNVGMTAFPALFTAFSRTKKKAG